MRVKFSIVVPTKYAYETILSTIRTILQQDFDNFEIVVSDAAHSDKLKSDIEKFKDERLIYYRPEKNLNFSGDWEAALSAAKGEYVTFLGDDDGMIPGALKCASDLFRRYNCDAVVWRKINYNWPNHLLHEHRNTLEGESSPVIDLVDSKKALKSLSKFRFGYNRLPCIYNSFVSMKAIEEVKKRSTSGRLFGGVIPDVYSSIAIASVINNYVYAYFPLTINAAAGTSSGVMQGIPDLDEKKKKLIPDVLSSHERYHKDIGPFNTSIAAIVMGEFLLAKEELKGVAFPKENWSAYVNYLHYEARGAKHPEMILKSAEFTKKARGITSLVPSKTNSNFSVPKCSFSGRLILPENLILDVEGAAKLCKSLIPKDASLNNYQLRGMFLSFFKSMFFFCYRKYQSFSVQLSNKKRGGF